VQLVSACPVDFAHRTQQWLEPAADVERRQLDAAWTADQAVLFMHWLSVRAGRVQPGHSVVVAAALPLWALHHQHDRSTIIAAPASCRVACS
jgi:hypothetical protein